MKEPCPTEIRARDLVGRPMLIVRTELSRKPYLVVFRKRNGGENFYFRACEVVADQLQRAPFLPVWAVMRTVKSIKHEGFYYTLTLAKTAAWKRAGHSALNAPLQPLKGQKLCKPKPKTLLSLLCKHKPKSP